MTQKPNNMKWIFATIGAIILLCIIMVFYLRKKYPSLTFAQWWHETWGWILLIILISIIIYWILWRMSQGVQKKEVDTVIAEKIMIEKVAERYKIPLYSRDKTGFKKLINPQDIKLVGAKKFYHPHTSIPFYEMELKINSGEYSGIDVWQVQLDIGEEHIRNNFQSWFVRHKTMNTMDKMRKMYPSATPQKQTEQILNAIAEKREEGEDTTGMEQMLAKSTDQEDSDAPTSSGYTPTGAMSSSKENDDVAKQIAEDYEQDTVKFREGNK